jgi:Winged helix-turn-helix DNA-binding
MRFGMAIDQDGQPCLAAMPHVWELQQDGRLTVTELAGRVDLSLSLSNARHRGSVGITLNW